jgi:hypothetical protein
MADISDWENMKCSQSVPLVCCGSTSQYSSVQPSMVFTFNIRVIMDTHSS